MGSSPRVAGPLAPGIDRRYPTSGCVDGECPLVHVLLQLVQKGASAVDPLQQILRAMRLECTVTARLEAAAPWGVRFCNTYPRFGFVVRGACWIEIDGVPEVQALSAGDGFVLTRGRAFVLRDAPRSRVVRCEDLVRGREGETIAVGGDGARTAVVSGTLGFDPAASRPLLEVLPELLHLRADEDEGGILRTTLELLSAETAGDRLGRVQVCARLGEILFIQAVRRFAAGRGQAQGICWLSALADPQIGAALRAMHADLARPWTVEALARAAGASRSGFALRFHALVGETPLAHLTRWRMHSASCHLRTGTLGLGEIAAQVGYESEAAFSRAFKRIVGRAPGSLRRP
jgi:AraC-like DNA-binding protein